MKLSKVEKSAFTLVELLLVLVLIALISGGVVVSFRGKQGNHALKVAGKNLSQAIRTSQQLAKDQGNLSRLRFNKTYTGFWIEQPPGVDNSNFKPVIGRGGTLCRFSEGVFISKIDSGNITFENLVPFLEFTADSKGFSGVITLRNRSGESLSVKVLKGVGQVYVIEQ